MHKKRLCLRPRGRRDPSIAAGEDPDTQDHHGAMKNVAVSPWVRGLFRRGRPYHNKHSRRRSD